MIFFRPHILALEARIADLQARLEKSEAERADLLDRLLERNHFEPIRKAVEAQPSLPSVQVIAPFGVQLPEVQNALRESWIEEEARYLMDKHGYDVIQAQAEASKRYDSGQVQFKVN